MIVQCDECNARFRLDDSKVSDQGTKVRCAKCKHIFIVRKESPADEADYDTFLEGLVAPAGGTEKPATSPGAAGAAGAVALPPREEQPSTVDFPSSGDLDFGAVDFSATDNGADEANAGTDFGEVDLNSASPSPIGDMEAGQSFDFGEVDFQTETAPDVPPEVALDIDFGEVNFDTEPASVSTHTIQEDFDISQFDSGTDESFAMPDESGASGEFDFAEPRQEEVSSAGHGLGASLDQSTDGSKMAADEQAAAFGPELAFDFGEFDMGSESVEDEAVVQGGPAPLPGDTPFTFNENPLEIPSPVKLADIPGQPPEEFSFGEELPFPPAVGAAEDFSFDKPEPASKQEAATSADGSSFFDQGMSPVAAVAEPAGNVPFEFGDFNFDDPEQAQKKDQQGMEDFFDQSSLPISADEPPPLSISSRRRGPSFLSVPLISLLVLLLVAGGGGYFVYAEGAAGLKRLGLGSLAGTLGLEKKDEGNIAVRNAASTFLRNREMVEVFVIRGEAVNNFQDPRTAIQIKTSLFGPKGEVLMQKNVYCGNALTEEQVVSMSPVDLEKAMVSPFGDSSLSNLAVQPGKGVPFAVVFSNVPKEAVDFGVEVVGSTVANK